MCISKTPNMLDVILRETNHVRRFKIFSPTSDLTTNIPCDNFFTPVPLAEELLLEHITLVRTIRKNKGEIPQEMMNKPIIKYQRNLLCLALPRAYYNNVPSKCKSVLAPSTLHHHTTTNGSDNKSEILLHYLQKELGNI